MNNKREKVKTICCLFLFILFFDNIDICAENGVLLIFFLFGPGGQGKFTHIRMPNCQTDSQRIQR